MFIVIVELGGHLRSTHSFLKSSRFKTNLTAYASNFVGYSRMSIVFKLGIYEKLEVETSTRTARYSKINLATIFKTIIDTIFLKSF